LTRPLLQDTWVISETGSNISVPVIYPWLNATGMDHMTRPGFLLALFGFKKVPKNAQFSGQCSKFGQVCPKENNQREHCNAAIIADRQFYRSFFIPTVLDAPKHFLHIEVEKTTFDVDVVTSRLITFR
jgi:hypothetical protein